MARPRSGALLVVLAALLSSLVAIPVVGRPAPAAAAVPSGFREYIVFSGLDTPTAVEFAPDGRVFVAERRGVVKVYSSVDDPTASVVADLRTKVFAAWDRGLLDIALDPDFPNNPTLYVLYTYDALPGGSAPHWGSAGVDIDPCPTPPGINTSGCVVTARLSKLTLSGSTWNGTEQPLVTDWCQQYPSHSIGSMVFGTDGALYVSGGEGASFGSADWGQKGTPINPCGDPPGGAMTPPTAEGGALRSQDVRTTADPTGLSGTVIRVDPATGAALPDNPLAGRSDANARRIVAAGLRNPFRITRRPGTGELWVGDVGWSTWEEINRIPNPTALTNFGWPCYEGTGHSAYGDVGLRMCDTLYSEGGVTMPYVTWHHQSTAFTGDTCTPGTGGSSTTGLAFYPGGSYPDDYDGALFHADYSRDCIWVMRRGANGLPDPNQRSSFANAAANPVELQVGPDGDLWYVDLGGTIRRIGFSAGNQPPLASIDASAEAGPAPLAVTFDGRGSTDPDAGDTLSYAWDLDGDGAFDDATGATASRTYTTNGTVDVKLRVTDAIGASDTASIVVTVGDVLPVPTIQSPSGTATFAVGQTVSFSGGATDPQDGTLPASRLAWTADLSHCPSPGNCHAHPGLFSQTGTASGSFEMPDHEYASQVQLKLTATDSDGHKASVTRLLDYKTVQLNVASSPPGVPLTVGGTAAATAPFTRTANVGGTVSVAAPASVTWNGAAYDFASWSDNGDRAHDLTVPASTTTLTAVYRPRTSTLFFDNFTDGNANGWQQVTGSWKICRPNGGKHSPALCSGTTATSTRLAGDPAWRDYSVEAAVYTTYDAGGAPLLGRARDSSHFYALQLTKDSAGVKRWMLQKRDGATVTTLASGRYSYVAKTYYTLKLTMKGSALTAYVSTNNGASWTRLGSATSATFASGRIGARSYGTTAAFDNVKVSAA
jgi:glucose/arabinose dehydrogenase